MRIPRIETNDSPSRAAHVLVRQIGFLRTAATRSGGLCSIFRTAPVEETCSATVWTTWRLRLGERGKLQTNVSGPLGSRQQTGYLSSASCGGGTAPAIFLKHFSRPGSLVPIRRQSERANPTAGLEKEWRRRCDVVPDQPWHGTLLKEQGGEDRRDQPNVAATSENDCADPARSFVAISSRAAGTGMRRKHGGDGRPPV